MNKIYLSILLLIFNILITGCSQKIDKNNHKIRYVNKIKQIYNSTTPSVSLQELNINFEKIDEISTISNEADSMRAYQPYSITFLNKDSFFVKSEGTIRFANSTGIISGPLTKRGQGPGEINLYLLNSFIYNEYICLTDQFCGIDFYDKNFNFKFRIKNKSYRDFSNRKVIYSGVPFNSKTIEQLTDSTFIVKGRYYMPVSGQNKNFNFMKGCFIFDKAFEAIKPLTEDSVYFSDSDERTIFEGAYQNDYAIGKGEFFTAHCTYDDYEVTCYDIDGNIKYYIKKMAARIPYCKKEKDMMSNYVATHGKKSDGSTPVWNEKYKKIIRFIHTDRKGRLWVNRSYKNEKARTTYLLFDIFDKGIYLNSVKLDFTTELIPNCFRHIYFKNDKIYLLDTERNNIKIYTY